MKYVGQSLVEFLFLSVCPVVIVDTDYVAATIRLYKKQWKIMRLPICKVIPQGVGAVFYQLENRSRKKQLLAVGAFSRRKGHLSLIAAMRWVKVRFPDFSLAIAGVVSDSEYYQAVKTSIHENECERNIHLHPNASSEELLRLYQDAGIFVLHSEEESQGIALCEAMAAGLPIVATNVGGVSCVVEDKVNGFLSDSGDIESFAENAINLLENDALAKRIGENNRVKSRRYDWRSLNAEIEEVYKFVTPKAARYPHGHHLDCL
jgi:glycosyltransferase involved in cell wall biosynthesis